MSLYHRAELAALTPTALPPVEDLARGADVLSIDQRTVAIVPHGDAKNKLELRLVFAAGRVTERQVYDPAAKKGLQTEKIEQAKPAAAPNLKPDLSKLVVLPLPYRTVAWAEAKTGVAGTPKRKLTDDEDALLTAALFAAASSDLNPPKAFTSFVNDRVGRTQRPTGLNVLLRACGDVSAHFAKSQSNESPDAVLASYLDHAAAQIPNASQLAKRDGLVREMAALHDIWVSWLNGPYRNSALQSDDGWKRTREFIERNRHNTLGWLALVVSAPYRNQNQQAWQSQAEAWQLFDSHPLYGYTARYERMRCLVNGGMPNTARMVFDDLYRQSLDAGFIPPLDISVKMLPANEMGVSWGIMLVKTATDLARNKHGFEALAVAEQCRMLGEPMLAREVLAAIEPEIKEAAPSLHLAAAMFLARLGDRDRADEYLTPVLKAGHFANQPLVWRLAADLAGQRRNTSRLASYLEKALDLEWEQMPETVDVQALRADYETLLNAYRQILTAHQETDTKVPANLVARIIKAADRWRAIDPDPSKACQIAARMLREQGETDLAWEYLTSPISLNPNEAAPFQGLAEELKGNNEPVLAERAYAAAFAAEPTNAQYLMDRANLLQQMGRRNEARAVLRKLADGTWQPRFDAVKNQARAMIQD
jgi:tetratricopeptide (TPR) repeat protein